MTDTRDAPRRRWSLDDMIAEVHDVARREEISGAFYAETRQHGRMHPSVERRVEILYATQELLGRVRVHPDFCDELRSKRQGGWG